MIPFRYSDKRKKQATGNEESHGVGDIVKQIPCSMEFPAIHFWLLNIYPNTELYDRKDITLFLWLCLLYIGLLLWIVVDVVVNAHKVTGNSGSVVAITTVVA